MATNTKKGPKLTDNSLYIAAGINPKTGLPCKFPGGNNSALKEDVKKIIKIIDEQDAVNRYIWYNLPCNISSQELERMIYIKGQLAFFYNEELDRFYFMPYALEGTIDFYGRFNSIYPVPYAHGTTEEEEKWYKNQEAVLRTWRKDCVYGVVPPEDLTYEKMVNSAVLLHDYSKFISEQIVPRYQINDAIIDTMAECIPFMRTSLIAGSGIKGVRVSDADQGESVNEGSRSLLGAALKGDPWVPILGAIDFQELTNGQPIKSEEYMLSMQSLDNFRLSTYGLQNGGLFEKKAHETDQENAINQSNVGMTYQDGLTIRQNFCNIVNSIWGLGIWCGPSEDILMQDLDGDGSIYDNNDDSLNSGEDNDGEQNS